MDGYPTSLYCVHELLPLRHPGVQAILLGSQLWRELVAEIVRFPSFRVTDLLPSRICRTACGNFDAGR